MKENLLDIEELSLVSGGVLKDGWEGALNKIMAVYKAKYGDEGKQKVKDLMVVGVKDPTSQIEEADLNIMYQYIDEQWDATAAFPI